MLSSILRGLAIASLRADALLGRLRSAALGAAAGFFSAALSSEEQTAVSVSVYERIFRNSARRKITAWEEDWFARRLPPPPAHVLIGAAGQGVEVLHLVARGYQVDALEPSPAGARSCSSAGARVVCLARYEDLVRDVLEMLSGPAASVAAKRYDAIVLGWGSLSLVLQAHERVRLLSACQRLAPRGPILASFLEQSQRGDQDGRTRAAGRAAGTVVGRARGLERGPCDLSAGLLFGSWFGFACPLSREEIDVLGRHVGRDVIWESGAGSGYPHVTIVSAGGGGSSEEAASSS